jgi:hypothetical protein
MEQKRTFPLFVIDTSRGHGKSRETDYISCTSAETPFVAEATMINQEEWENNDAPRVPYIVSEPRGGIRVLIKVVSYQAEPSASLLRRALKEYLTRRQSVPVNINNISNDAVVSFVNVLIGQTAENLRENPNDSQAICVNAILHKIKNDYGKTTEK